MMMMMMMILLFAKISHDLCNFFFGFLILPGCLFKCCDLFSHEAQGQNVPNSMTEGMGFIADMFQTSHKQWEVAILILINTSASIKFRIVEMDN